MTGAKVALAKFQIILRRAKSYIVGKDISFTILGKLLETLEISKSLEESTWQLFTKLSNRHFFTVAYKFVERNVILIVLIVEISP